MFPVITAAISEYFLGKNLLLILPSNVESAEVDFNSIAWSVMLLQSVYEHS